MGTCQSRAHGSTEFDKDGGHQTLDNPFPDKQRLSKDFSSVKTPRNGRILHNANKSSKDTHVVSPSEETLLTVPPTPFPCSLADENSSFSSADEQSWNSLPLATFESGPSPIHCDSASTITVGNPSVVRLSTKEQYGDIPVDHEDLVPSSGLFLAQKASNGKQRITTPESVVYRSAAPLIAPRDVPLTIISPNPLSNSSVDPQTLASFNRLKIQVQLAEQNELHNRRKAKLEDRLEDVKGYRNLWKEFETIKHQAARAPGDELADITKNPSMKLHDPESWYFDFNPLQTLHIEGGNDENSISSVSLLSERTMEAQRRYYKEKSRERNEKRKEKLRETSCEMNVKHIVDDEPIASILLTDSRESTDKSKGKRCDYGQLSPRVCTARSHINIVGDSTIHDDGASVMSDLDMDADNLVTLSRTRDEKSEGTPMDGLTSFSAATNRSTPQSCIQHFGFDALAPLSSQLEVFAQSVPSVQIEDAKSGIVHWREFPVSCGRTPATARRLQGVFEQDNSTSNKQIEWEPHSVSKPVFGGCSILQRKMKCVRLQHATPNTGLSTRQPKLPRQTPEGHGAFRNQSPYDAMSPSQFLMMSSYVRSGEDDVAENSLFSPGGCEKLRFEDIPDNYELHEPLQPRSSDKQEKKKDSDKLFVDPNISILSTDAFLMLSSWPAPATDSIDKTSRAALPEEEISPFTDADDANPR